jgi:endonuclease I
MFTLLLCLPILSWAQLPQNYYNDAVNLTGNNLFLALHNIIKGHTSISYGELWNAFKTTDKKSNGKVWDIYSDKPGGVVPYEFTFTSDQCGDYNSENDCYNREHSWPQSYFNEGSPMRSDLFHVYPTDGWVNNKRSNDAYGLVDTTLPYWQSQNGSRSGVNMYPGYSGTVFEPIDSFKGDLARTYFYMATRYYSEDGGWGNWAMANGADLKYWAIDMLLEWHKNDPVSSKEISRNNAIYAIQNNRNPFIDHPEYVECIWGNSNCVSDPEPNAIVSVDLDKKVIVYPNPAHNEVTVDWHMLNPDETLAIDVVNVTGLVWYSTQKLSQQSGKLNIDVSNWHSGVYLLKISTTKMVIHKKIIVQ